MRQVVVIEGGLTYHWDGEPPLEVGDRVLLPENWLSRARTGPGPWEGTVAQLGSDYQGQTVSVLQNLRP
jgi:hypothetical protein